MNILLVIIVWAGISLGVCRTSIKSCFFRLSIKKSGLILIGLPLYITWSFPLAAFNIFSLFCMFSVLMIMYQVDFIFWSNLFGALYVSYTLIDTFIFRLENVSSMIKLKLFCVSLTRVSSLSPITIIFTLKVSNLMLVQIS